MTEHPEMHGLRVIVDEAVQRGTLHMLAPAPEEGAFATREEYERAYVEWHRGMTHWTVIIDEEATSVTESPVAIEVTRCPECGYAEIANDGSSWGPRSLSDDWCGHNRDNFQRERYVRDEG